MAKRIFIGLLLGLFICGSITSCAAPEKLEGKKVMALLQETVDQVAKITEPSVVYIEVTMSGRPYRMNGLILDTTGRILAPFALPRDRQREGIIERIAVWVERQEYQGELVQSDDRVQISLIKIPVENPTPEGTLPLRPIKFGDANTLKPGQWLVSVQNAGQQRNYQKFVDLGIAGGKFMGNNVEEILLRLNETRFLGMPVMNLNGELVGLIHQGNRVIAINEVKKSIDKLIAKASKGQATPESAAAKEQPPWIGFIYGILNEDYAEAMKLPKESVQIQYVFKDGPGDKAGLKPDDLIIEIDGQPINETGERALGKARALLDPEIGREVVFKILREAMPREIKATFVAKPEPKEFIAEDIGIKVQDIRDIEHYERRLSIREGVLVDEVIPGSPAATSNAFGRALINPNNVIIELNNQPTRSVNEFINVVNEIRRTKLPVVLVKFYQGTYSAYSALNLGIGQEKKGDPK